MLALSNGDFPQRFRLNAILMMITGHQQTEARRRSLHTHRVLKFAPISSVVRPPRCARRISAEHDYNFAKPIPNCRSCARDAARGGTTSGPAVIQPFGREAERFGHVD